MRGVRQHLLLHALYAALGRLTAPAAGQSAPEPLTDHGSFMGDEYGADDGDWQAMAHALVAGGTVQDRQDGSGGGSDASGASDSRGPCSSREVSAGGCVPAAWRPRPGCAY